MTSVNPFEPNLKLESLHAALKIESLGVEAGGRNPTGQSVVDEAKVVYAWLKEE